MKKSLSLLLILMPLLFRAQSAPDDVIHWKERSKLSWADYQGKADPDAGAAASTATFLGVEYNFKDGNFGYTITCSFSKSKSWGLHKNDYILAHEQGHFDIAEIFARQLHKNLKAYVFDKKNYQSDLRKIYEDITAVKEAMQNKYDGETDHSINKEKQAEWQEKIGKELKNLEAFSKY
jgi:hypothetical protein